MARDDVSIFRQGVLDLSLWISHLQILNLIFFFSTQEDRRFILEKRSRSPSREGRSLLYSAICTLPLNLARFRLTFKLWLLRGGMTLAISASIGPSVYNDDSFPNILPGALLRPRISPLVAKYVKAPSKKTERRSSASEREAPRESAALFNVEGECTGPLNHGQSDRPPHETDYRIYVYVYVHIPMYFTCAFRQVVVITIAGPTRTDTWTRRPGTCITAWTRCVT